MSEDEDLRKLEEELADLERDPNPTPMKRYQDLGPCMPSVEVVEKVKAKSIIRVVSKVFDMFYMQQLMDNPEEFLNVGGVDPSRVAYDNIYAPIKALKAKSEQCTSTHVMITINVNPTIDYSTLQKRVDKFVNKQKWVMGNYLYSIEQRGLNTAESLMGTGIHAHVLLVRPKTTYPSRIKQYAKQAFDPIVGTDKALYFTWYVGNPPIDYVMGNKKDDSKMEKVNIDKAWRKTVGLEDYYRKGDLVPVIAPKEPIIEEVI